MPDDPKNKADVGPVAGRAAGVSPADKERHDKEAAASPGAAADEEAAAERDKSKP
jgi:hypothetical protein